MIKNYVVFRDWETGSRNRYKCQPIQLAAVIVDLQRMEVVEDSLFNSTLLPEFDDAKCEELGIDPIQDEALKVNGHTREGLANAPHPKLVWQQYGDYLKNYNIKGKDGGKWNAPCVAGYNQTGFDNEIDIRMCQKYGPKLDDFGGWTLYHPFLRFDVQEEVASWFACVKINPQNSISMDAMREYLGYSKDGAHDAKVDVIQGADMGIRFWRLKRAIMQGKIDLPQGKKIKFKNCVDGAL